MHSADLARMSAKAKGEMPGRTNEAEKKASEVGTEIGQKIDSAVSIPSAPFFIAACSYPSGPIHSISTGSGNTLTLWI